MPASTGLRAGPVDATGLRKVQDLFDELAPTRLRSAVLAAAKAVLTEPSLADA